jgi:hypothetical protein
MARRRRVRRKRIKARNPLAPVLRRLRPRVKASARVYSRKIKHRRPAPDAEGG